MIAIKRKMTVQGIMSMYNGKPEPVNRKERAYDITPRLEKKGNTIYPRSVKDRATELFHTGVGISEAGRIFLSEGERVNINTINYWFAKIRSGNSI